MQISRHRTTILIVVLIAVFVILAFLIRTLLPLDKIFTDEGIKFSSIDAYYQVSIIDNWVHNFPSLTKFQPFLIHPGGHGYGEIHFFNFLISVVIWIIGFGSPSQHLVDIASAYYPAVLAALTVIPVYFIGKALVNKWMGVIAAAFFSVMPGEYLGRSILGFTDQHVMETLLTALAGLFVILAIKTARERELGFQHILNRDWKIINRPILYSLLAGLFMALYLVTWLGALLFAFIITTYLVIQFIVDHLSGHKTAYLGITGFFFFFPIPVIMYWPLAPSAHYLIPLIIAMLVPPVLAVVSSVIARRGLRPYFYPVALAVTAGILLLLFYLIAPSSFSFTFQQLGIFNPSGSSAETTMEMQPFLSPSGEFSTQVAWGNFTTSFFLFPWWPIPGFGLIGLIVMVVVSIRERGERSRFVFVLVWSIIILILTLVQRRFAYYLVINISLLSAYLTWLALWRVGIRYLTLVSVSPGVAAANNTPTLVTTARMNPKKKHHKGIPAQSARRTPTSTWTPRHTIIAMVLAAMLLIFVPNLNKSIEVAKAASYAPSDAWYESLQWIEKNTPEPLGEADAYFQYYDGPIDYPDTAYAVTSWWDYGYWITRTAHRAPSANPSQDPKRIKPLAELLLSTDETEWGPLLGKMETGYIVIDNTMVSTKFWAIVNWAGLKLDDYISMYAIPQEGKLVTVSVYNPLFYQTLLARLYNFDGQAVTGGKPVVLEYVEKVDSASGNAYRQVTNITEPASYQEAVDYIKSQESGNFVIVGASPLASPVVLEAPDDFKLVYESSQKAAVQSNVTTSEVKVFEYSPE